MVMDFILLSFPAVGWQQNQCVLEWCCQTVLRRSLVPLPFDLPHHKGHWHGLDPCGFCLVSSHSSTLVSTIAKTTPVDVIVWDLSWPNWHQLVCSQPSTMASPFLCIHAFCLILIVAACLSCPWQSRTNTFQFDDWPQELGLFRQQFQLWLLRLIQGELINGESLETKISAFALWSFEEVFFRRESFHAFQRGLQNDQPDGDMLEEWLLHYAKSYRPFELFVNENYKL